MLVNGLKNVKVLIGRKNGIQNTKISHKVKHIKNRSYVLLKTKNTQLEMASELGTKKNVPLYCKFQPVCRHNFQNKWTYNVAFKVCIFQAKA